jgi:hypothetical protein
MNKNLRTNPIVLIVLSLFLLPVTALAARTAAAGAGAGTASPVPAQAGAAENKGIRLAMDSALRIIAGSEGQSHFQTAVVTYSKPAAPRFKLVGDLHIGTESYFDTLSKHLLPAMAKKVFFEAPEFSVPKNYRASRKPGEMCQLLAKWHPKLCNPENGAVAELLNLKISSEIIDVNVPHFIRVGNERKEDSLDWPTKERDCREHLFAAMMKTVKEEEYLTLARLVVVGGHSYIQSYLERWMGQRKAEMAHSYKLPRNVDASRQIMARDVLASPLNKDFFSDNEIAIKQLVTAIAAHREPAASAAAAQVDYAVFYGAMHLPYFEKKLLELGYQVEHIEWVTAFSWKEPSGALSTGSVLRLLHSVSPGYSSPPGASSSSSAGSSSVASEAKVESSSAFSPAAAATNIEQCVVCGISASDVVKLLQCSGCQTQRYCGGDCQKKAWPKHKATCRQKKK